MCTEALREVRAWYPPPPQPTHTRTPRNSEWLPVVGLDGNRENDLRGRDAEPTRRASWVSGNGLILPWGPRDPGMDFKQEKE